MAEKQTKVAIIGAGEESIPILHTLSSLEHFQIVGIADERKDAPALKVAQELKIVTEPDFKKLVCQPDLGLIIETSGSAAFGSTIKSLASHQAIILDHEGATLLVDLAKEQDRLQKVETAYKLSQKYAELIEESNRKLDEKVLELTLLNEASKTFSTAFDKRNIGAFISTLLRRRVEFGIAALLVTEEKENNLILSSDMELGKEIVDEIRLRAAERFSSLTKLKLKAQDLSVLVESGQKKGKFEGPITNFYATPLMVFDKILGLLCICRTGEEHFSSEDEQFLSILAGHVALFIENDRIRAQITSERNQMDSILQDMVEGLLVVDFEDKVIRVNPVAEQLLGVKQSDIYEKVLTDVVAKEVAQLVSLLRQQKTAFLSKEITLTNQKDKLPRILLVGMSKIPCYRGEGNGVVVVLHDITREKEVDRMKSEFISITSHELRTPLASIKQAIYLVLSETVGKVNEQQKKFLDIGKRNVDRLGNLINDLLDISKIEAGKMKLERKLGNLNELVADIVGNFAPAATEKKITLDKKLQADLVKIYFDPDKIAQVLANLINNSIKFTPENGQIVVQSSYYGSDPNYVCVSVKDNGEGIAKEDFDKLFKKFQQLDMRLTRKTGGTGLGLALSKQVVELHGGKIWAESEGKGKGTTFSFILPKEEKAMGESAKKKILVIDDEKDLCETAQGIITAKGYVVSYALSGQEGLDKVKSVKPDLIVLDLMMPGMDGFAVAENLKKNPDTAQIPILVLTALDQEQSAKKALALGAKGYLVKPFEPDSLLFTIEEFLK